MTESEVSRLVAVIVAAFPHARPSAGMSAVYERGLRDLDARIADAAVMELLKTAKYLPSIAEIRECAARRRVEGGQITAGEAWCMVLREVSRVGVYRSPRFDHPAVATAVAQMGWENICNSENQIADRAHFFRIFDAALAASTRRENLAPALGTIPGELAPGEVASIVTMLGRRLNGGDT